MPTYFHFCTLYIIVGIPIIRLSSSKLLFFNVYYTLTGLELVPKNSISVTIVQYLYHSLVPTQNSAGRIAKAASISDSSSNGSGITVIHLLLEF